MVDTPLPIDLGDTPAPAVPEPLPLNDGTGANPEMTEERAQRLAFQTVFGQKKDSNHKKSFDEVLAQMNSGQEDMVRQEIATNRDSERAQKVQSLVTNLMSQTVQPVNALSVQLAVNTAKGKPTDPSTIIEKDYGYQYVSELDRTAERNPYTIYSQFAQLNPEGALGLKQHSGTMVTQREIAHDILEGAKARLKAQSWGIVDPEEQLIAGPAGALFNSPSARIQSMDEYKRADGWGGYLADMAKPFINPLYNNMKLRGLVNDRWFSGFGTNLVDTQLEYEISFLNTIFDPAEYKAKLSALVERVGNHNPALAVKIAESAHGRSTSQVNADNAFDVLDLTIVGAGVAKGVRSTYRLGKGLTEDVVIKRAARDMVRSAENSTEPPVVSMAQGAGDVQEAGIQKAVDLLQKDDIQKQADALTSSLKTNRIFITTDRGPAPVERGFTRYFFGGDDASTTKVVHKSFEDATNHGASPNPRYVDLPEDPRPTRTLTPEEQVLLQPYETRPPHSNNYRELATRLVNTADKFIRGLQKGILEMSRVERIPALLKVEAAMRAVTEDLKNVYPALSDHILDITTPVKNTFTNHYDYSYIIGQKGARHFEDFATAEEFGRLRLSNIEHTVEGEGQTFFVRVTKPLPLNADIVRDGLLASQSSLAKERGPIREWFSRYRTPDEIMSQEHRENRKVAVYSAAIYNNLRKSQEKYIQDLQNGVFKTDPVTGEPLGRLSQNRLSRDARLGRLDQWNRMVEAAKSYEHPVTGEPGYWFRTIGEIEDFYLLNYKRRPDNVEIQAYFAQKNLSDMDHAMRNWRVVTNMKQNGVQQFRVNALSADGKNMVQSQWFDGVPQSKLPSGDESILVIADHLEDSHIGILNKSGPKFTNDVRKLVEKGEHIIVRFWMPEKMPLLDFGKFKPEDGNPVYAMIKASRHEVKDIAWEQVPYRDGGHYVYDAEHYIKQAWVIEEKIGNVFRRRYLGDTTILPMKIRAMGEDVARKLDSFRQILKDRGPDVAKDYLKVNPIGIDFKEVHGWFLPKKDMSTGLTHPPMLNKNERIQVVRKNDNIWDKTDELRSLYPHGKPGEIEDGRKSSLATQYSVEYTGQRDAVGLKTIHNEGTASNPAYKYVDAEYLDPIPVLQRSLSRILNSTFLDDYKNFAVEHWIQEAAGRQKVMRNSLAEFRAAPFYFFHKGEFRPDAAEDVVNRLEAQRKAIQDLLGKETSWTRTINATYDTLTDKIYRGEGIGKVTPQWLADWMLPIATDPVSYLRTMSFHAKLGLFAVPQLLVQSASYVNMYAIAGWRPASMGSAAATFRMWDAVNPAHRAFLDAKLSGLRLPGHEKYWWKPGEFTEATELLERTGYGHVQNEVSYLGDNIIQSSIRSNAGQFLDAGTWFFRMGEKNTRHGSWYIAYKEFRAKNPEGKITEADLRSILDRADLLSGNMSRASSSILHQGVLSAATQFMAYQIRISEQLTGGRLNNYERGRLVAVNAALYGIPAATGLSGVPVFGDYMRQKMIENGYIPGAHWYSTLIGDGLLGMLSQAVGGNVLNFANRLGNWGYEPIREVLRDDPDILKLVGGAPYSIVSNSMANLDPFFKYVQSQFREENFNLTKAHVADIFTELAGANNLRKTLVGVNTSKYLSNRGLYLDDVSVTKSLLTGLTGLRDVRIDDLRHYRDLHKEMDNLQRDAVRGFVRETQRSLQALADKNPELADEYQANAKFYAVASGLPPEREQAVFKQAITASQSLINKIDWQFYGDRKNVPPGKEQLYAKTYRTIQEMRNLQGKQ